MRQAPTPRLYDSNNLFFEIPLLLECRSTHFGYFERRPMLNKSCYTAFIVAQISKHKKLCEFVPLIELGSELAVGLQGCAPFIVFFFYRCFIVVRRTWLRGSKGSWLQASRLAAELSWVIPSQILVALHACILGRFHLRRAALRRFRTGLRRQC